MRYAVLFGLLTYLFSAQSVAAVAWSMHGSLKSEAAYFLQAQSRWDKLQQQLVLKPELQWENWEFRSRVMAWYDVAADINPRIGADVAKYYRHHVAVKEAYLLYGADNFDLRVGQQQVVWGKTDGLRLLDVINPLDMRAFILDDFLDSRMGLVAARVNYYPQTDMEQEIEVLWIPDARPTRAAPTGSAWAMSTAGAVLPMLPRHKPNFSAQNSELGMAWRANLSGWDMSLNYFYGWKDSPNFFLQLPPLPLQAQLKHQRMHTVGGSFASVVGSFVFRGELAINASEPLNQTTPTWSDSVVKKNTMNMALSMAYNKGNWTISPQFFMRHISGWKNTLQAQKKTGFWSLRIARNFMHEKLKTEMLLLASWSDGSWMSRYKIAYEINDQLALSCGADFFCGKRGLLGQFDKNDRVHSDIKYVF
ncbi:MAG: hypothetical protein Q9M28_02360 [Mariprofundaceae bacterium]|nr:hypothetical protein [Mariprofundaceae bacterium]